MIEQYQKEMSEVHAPKELIERTKAAMDEEQEHLDKAKQFQNNDAQEAENPKKVKGKKGKLISLQRALPAVAAILLLIFVPAALKDSPEEIPMQLGQEKDEGIVKIEKDIALEKLSTEIEIEAVSEMPDRFEDAEKVTQGEYTFYLLVKKSGAGFEAYAEGYLVSGVAEDQEHFLVEAERLIREKKHEI